MLEKYFYFLVFFTTWNIILVIFHKYTYDKIDIQFSSFIVLFLGLYMSLVKPKKYTYHFNDKTYTITGLHKLLVDVPLHFMVFLFVYMKYYKYYSKVGDKHWLSVVCIMILYLISMDTNKVYGLSKDEMLLVFSVICIVYVAVYS